MKEGYFYVTNTKGTGNVYNKYFMIFRDNKIEFEEFAQAEYIFGSKSGTFNAICIL